MGARTKPPIGFRPRRGTLKWDLAVADAVAASAAAFLSRSVDGPASVGKQVSARLSTSLLCSSSQLPNLHQAKRYDKAERNTVQRFLRLLKNHRVWTQCHSVWTTDCISKRHQLCSPQNRVCTPQACGKRGCCVQHAILQPPAAMARHPVPAWKAAATPQKLRCPPRVPTAATRPATEPSATKQGDPYCGPSGPVSPLWHMGRS